MANRIVVTIPEGDIAVHELTLTPGVTYVIRWTDPLNAFELINHSGNPVWFTTDGRPTKIRGGYCRVGLPYSSTVVNQLRRSAWQVCFIAENPATITVVAT